MPDITKAQVLALLTFAVGQAVAMGLIDDERGQLVLQAGVALVSLAYLLADAHLRNGRAKAMAQIHVANAQIAQATGIDAKPDPEV